MTPIAAAVTEQPQPPFVVVDQACAFAGEFEVVGARSRVVEPDSAAPQSDAGCTTSHDRTVFDASPMVRLRRTELTVLSLRHRGRN